MLISVCIPCYRSEKTIAAVCDEVREEFQKHSEHRYQLILVNDGSPDGTWEVIRSLCQADGSVLGVNLSRNYGQNAAKMAAVPLIRGDVAVFMDDDGQHPACGIFTLVNKLNEGYDVVYAKFAHKKHGLFKRLASWGQRKLGEWVGNKPKGIAQSSFLAWSRVSINAMRDYHSPFPSNSGYLMHVTTRFANVELEHRERLAGHSGYTLKKMLTLWLTAFTNFSIVPLRFSAALGGICAGLGFLSGLVLIIRKLVHPNIAAGYTSILAMLLFIGGIIMIILGLIGEYIGRIYMTVSDMPVYRIRETLNTTPQEDSL